MKDYISIGITGGIGSGKSYICRIVETMGYPVFYSDSEAKKIITSNPSAVTGLKELFGEEAYSQGNLNKDFLADQIFTNPALREKMNDLVHPLVRQEYHDWAKSTASKIVFNEAAILFETGSYKSFDKTILVVAPKELRVERVKKRDQANEEDILARMNAQWTDEKKKALADFVLINDEKTAVLPQLNVILAEIK